MKTYLNQARKRVSALAIISTFASGGICFADPITYEVDQTIDGATVTGMITTNGTIGPIVFGDVTSVDLTLLDGENVYPVTLQTGFGDDLSASAAYLYYNYSSGDGNESLFSQDPEQTAYWALSSVLESSSGLETYKTPTYSASVEMTGVQVVGTAETSPSIPEPSTWGLLAIGLLGLLSSRRGVIIRTGISTTPAASR